MNHGCGPCASRGYPRSALSAGNHNEIAVFPVHTRVRRAPFRMQAAPMRGGGQGSGLRDPRTVGHSPVPHVRATTSSEPVGDDERALDTAALHLASSRTTRRSERIVSGTHRRLLGPLDLHEIGVPVSVEEDRTTLGVGEHLGRDPPVCDNPMELLGRPSYERRGSSARWTTSATRRFESTNPSYAAR